MQGIVSRVKREGNYGFIKSDKADYFFHKSSIDYDWNDLCDDIEKGVEVKVEFEPKRTDKGLRAEEVELV